MDERHHPYPQQPQHPQPRGGPDHGAPAPWPTYQAATPASQPWQQQLAQHQVAPRPEPHAMPPQTSQYQYASSEGFVQPGAPGGYAQPMSAHGGTIGIPMQPSHPDAMPMLHGTAAHHSDWHHGGPVPQAPVAAMPGAEAMLGGAAIDPYAHPQAWAFPTPHGLQLVQPGAPEAAGATMSGTASTRGARRLKWETIVPACAVACLLAAVALFISDFDRITGRDTAVTAPASSAKLVVATEPAVSDEPSEDETSATLSEATALFEAGRFDEASNMLHPLLDAEAPDPEAVALHDRVETASQRNDALLAQLQRQRRAGKWTSVIRTIDQIEGLRPLSPTLIKLRQHARTAVRARGARARARARAATAQRRASAPSRNVGGPPPSGGLRGGGTTNRPPASSPASPASIPPRPDAPNPISNPGSGASAVGGGAASAGSGSNCHSHDGVTECH